MHVRIASTQPIEGRQAVHAGHAHVEQHDVRIGLSHERQDLGRDVGLADDLEASVSLEYLPDTGEHHGVVVGNHDPHSVFLSSQSDVECRRRSGSSVESRGESRPVGRQVRRAARHIASCASISSPTAIALGWSWMPLRGSRP